MQGVHDGGRWRGCMKGADGGGVEGVHGGGCGGRNAWARCMKGVLEDGAWWGVQADMRGGGGGGGEPTGAVLKELHGQGCAGRAP